MEMYHFVTQWFFLASVEQVWRQIADLKSYPTKWPVWKKATLRGSERELRHGSVIDYVARGIVPITGRFTFEITAFQPPTLLEYVSSGDIVGKCKWLVEPCDDGAVVTSCWDVGLSIAVINLVSKLPFVKPIMSKHHDLVMAQGYQGFKAILESHKQQIQ